MEAKSTRIECDKVYMTPDANCGDTEENCKKEAIESFCLHKLTLGNTAAAMNSHDYKKRFIAEYVQTKIRYERLKAFNTRIEAANRTNEWRCRYEMPKVEMPKHDCPDDILEQQQHLMGQYLHILEVRAVIEGIDLSNY